MLGMMFTPFTAIIFLVFTLLYTPCVAAVATVKREMGGAKAAAITVLVQCAIAWMVAFLVHGIGIIFICTQICTNMLDNLHLFCYYFN